MTHLNFEVFSTPAAWVSLLTLTFLEIVLGVDNIIFISIVAGKLPAKQQPKARTIGLAIALVARIILLSFLSWIIQLTQPLFTLPIEDLLHALDPHAEASVSGKDIILIIGGFFLLAKSTTEIHSKVSAKRKLKI